MTNTIENMFSRMGAVSSIVLPSMVTATWKNESDARHCAKVLRGIKLKPEVFADPTGNGNWIVTAGL